MEYNSQKEELIIPEYGRNIQILIQHAKTIENKELRQRFVEKIIDLMHQMNPQNRNMEDYRDKLWKHLFRIAKYEIDVVPPSGQAPGAEEANKKPEPVPYPSSGSRFRHYGNNVQRLIKSALEMEPGPKRDSFVKVIGSYMKLAYRTWNKEHFVSDEVIKSDLEAMSDLRLTLKEEDLADHMSANAANRRRGKPQRPQQPNNGGQHNSGNGKPRYYKGGPRSKRKG
jgi:hypothetical protein